MGTMRVVQVAEAGGPLELREREIPEPASGEVRVRVQACGVCHSDSYAKEGHFPGVTYPVVPGHEVAGVVDGIGEDVHGWKVGERVGVGWFGGNCGYCEPCRRGDLVDCRNKPIPGVTVDGGYAEYLVCRAAALALVPDDLRPEEAAPLMCAGVTTFNALRRSGARAGGLVAVLGIGGLGHLGVQFAVRLGFETVAIARGKEKEELARRLGAHHYVDSNAEDVAEALLRLGGASAILATVTSASAMTAAFGGLGPRGKLIVVGATGEPLAVAPGQLIGGNRSIHGHASGTSMDSQDTLAFSALTAVRPMIETVPLEQAADAYERMMANKARFRMVLLTGPLQDLH
jgi:D-arabinose 1-dehydrogenase-like Zn-dependent alcohol dehydrogenase